MIKRLLLLVVLVGALLLRSSNYLNRTTYGWDQIRDLSVLDQTIASGKLPLLGPIVRGTTGGFYLGPLYHYLLTPLYSLSHGNPLILVGVSLTLDVLTAGLLGLWVSPFAGILWGVSSMLISSSLTPWNVSLIHPWILGVIWLFSRLKHRVTPVLTTLFILLLATSTSIHLTLLPIAVTFLLWFFPLLVRSRPRLAQVVLYLLAGFVPQLPLILSDLQTSGSNLRAFKDFLLVHTQTVSPSLLSFSQIFLSKLGLTVSRLFVGQPYLLVGLVIFLLLLVTGIRRARQDSLALPSLVIVGVTVVSLWLYRDLDFAEYYFNAMLVPLVILASLVLSTLRPVFAIPALALCVFTNLTSLSFAATPFSLGVKSQLVNEIPPFLANSVDLQLLLPDYQQFGFAYFLARRGYILDHTSHQKILIAPSSLEHVPAPPESPSVVFQTQLAAFRVVVFSN